MVALRRGHTGIKLKFEVRATRQLRPPPPQKKRRERERAPGWLAGTVWCPFTNSSLQVSIFPIHQIFNILYALNLTYPLRKIYLSQNSQISDPKIYTKPQKVGYVLSEGIWLCLKRERKPTIDYPGDTVSVILSSYHKLIH